MPVCTIANVTVGESAFADTAVWSKCFRFNLPVHVPERFPPSKDAATFTANFFVTEPPAFVAVIGIMNDPAAVNVPLITPSVSVSPAGNTAENVIGACPIALIVYVNGASAVAMAFRFVSTGGVTPGTTTLIRPCM